MDNRYKHIIGKEVSPEVPYADAPNKVVPLQQVEEIAAASGGGASDPLVITQNHELTPTNNNSLISVEDYASIIVPSGLGLNYRVDISRDTDKTVSFTPGENVVLQLPDDEIPELLKKYNGASLAPKKIENGIEYWGLFGAFKTGVKLAGLKQTVAISDLSIAQMSFPFVYKSSDFPEFTTTKEYFTIYSTDHETNANAEIWWGEMDDPEGTNFIQRSQIITGKEGYQCESPFLIRIPTAKSGLGDELFVYFHTSTNDPENGGVQQTHLITTSGGAEPHNCSFTLRKNSSGEPVMGLEAGENHTGYGQYHLKADGNFVAYHSIYVDSANVSNNKSAVSFSSDGLNWTRGNEILAGEAFPDASGRYFSRLDIWPFELNGTLYGFVHSEKNLSLCTINPTTYKPDTFIKDLYYKGDQFYQQVFRIENGISYVWFKDSTVANLAGDWYLFKYNLSDI